MAADESIQFVANFDGFLSVKKLKIEKEVKNTDIVEFLTGIAYSCNEKIKDYLAKIVDLEALESKTENLFDLDLTNFIEEVYSRKVKKIITDLMPDEIQKKQKDAFAQAYQVYLINLYSEKKGVILSFNNIVFPSQKKMMKKKKK